MGRKIPAKKHRGVKDPLEQQARRFQSLKGKINAPPKDPDEQPVPRSLSRLFAFRDELANKPNKQKKPKRTASARDASPSGVGRNPVAGLKKLPGESGRGFSLRINSAIRALHDPLEQDYPQDVEAEDVKGEQMAAQRARRLRKRKGKGTDAAPQDKLTRGQKLTLKKNAKKQKAAEEAKPEVVYERVPFGAVAEAPPALPPPRHAPAAAGAPRPGRRDLLLSAMLPGGAGGGAGGGGRLRALPAAERMRRERARLDAVAAYRQLQKQRRLEQTDNNKKKRSKS